MPRGGGGGWGLPVGLLAGVGIAATAGALSSNAGYNQQPQVVYQQASPQQPIVYVVNPVSLPPGTYQYQY